MRELSEDEMRTYVDSGEWQDKAGGYAIQETADRFVTGLEGGGWDNVVGLPVALSVELLASLGGPDLADPRSNR
jgi:septum formation protein